MARTKTVKTYKWEYEARDTTLVCLDNSNPDARIQAMCDSPETAKCFADVLNEPRKPEEIL